MNFIFISPNFPANYWEFCAGLKANGVNVLGIADAPYDALSYELKESLTEYYRVESLENYEQVYRAVAFFAHKYGFIDWIESNNEYWLRQDARLRRQFGVTTGIQGDNINDIMEKSSQKRLYEQAGIPTARQLALVAGKEAAWDFVKRIGYPVIVKPDRGVGAAHTFKVSNDDELRDFLDNDPNYQDYVMEQFISGNIRSYDAIINSKGEPIFESMAMFPPSIMDIVNNNDELTYCIAKEVPEALRELGRKTVKAFGITRRFVHMEFFCLTRDHAELGKEGDFVALEVNVRPAGADTPDMMNYAHSTDVYKIWADMVAFDESRTPLGDKFFCAYASRRDMYQYVTSMDEIYRRYGQRIMMHTRMPDVLASAMGNEQIVARLNTLEEVEDFTNLVKTRK